MAHRWNHSGRVSLKCTEKYLSHFHFVCHSMWLYIESSNISKVSVIQMMYRREILFTEFHGQQVKFDEAVGVCQFYFRTLLLGLYFLLQGRSDYVTREKKATWKIYFKMKCKM